MVMKKEYICINCPLSCDVTLTDDNGVLSVTGHTCKRGEAYAKNEYTDPVRMLTTTVMLNGNHDALLPVISGDMIPKKVLKECIELLYKVKVSVPIIAGDVVVENILGTGIDILSAKTVNS